MISLVFPVASSAGITPARSTDAFPDPDAPSTARNRYVASRSKTFSTRRFCPKNRSASSGPNAVSPTYGGSASGSGSRVPSETACQRDSHSVSSPAHAFTYASVTASVGSLRPPTASDNVPAE